MLLLLLSLFSLSLCESVQHAKDVAGPPSEFDLTSNDPHDYTFHRQASAILILDKQDVVEVAEGTETWITGEVPVDSPSLARFSFILPYKGNLRVVIEKNGVREEELPRPIVEVWPMGDDMYGESEVLYAYTFSFSGPDPGMWSVRVAAEERDLPLTKVALLVFNANPNLLLELTTSSSLGLRTGDNWDLTAFLQPPANDDIKNLKPMGIIERGEVVVEDPNGQISRLKLQNLGPLPEYPGEDEWGTSLKVDIPGLYTATVLVEGETEKNVPFVRSYSVTAGVVRETARLGDSARVHPSPGDRLTFEIEVTEPSSHKFQAYAQVYGTSLNDPSVSVPVAWMSSMVYVQHGGPGPMDYKNFVALNLDGDWLAAASATSPFVLKNLSLTAMEAGDVVVSEEAEVSVHEGPGAESLIEKVLRKRENDPRFFTSGPSSSWFTTREMREGVMPEHLRARSNATETTVKLILVHGYCSSANPFFHNYDFASPACYFLDSSANRDNDDFANRVMDFAYECAGPNDVWSMIGHSQGGMAITHLKTYYWTPLDVEAPSRRVLQTLGTPFGGCSMAGNAATLGNVFSVGCGPNTDLALPGADEWIRSIVAGPDTYYYTSTYKLGKFLGDHCNLAVNSILQWPNDGTTELTYASRLPGAHDMGNTEEQCHIGGMKYKAQYTDNTRNAEMDSHSR